MSQAAAKEITHATGVRFRSPLLKLDYINIVDVFALDILHHLLLGVARHITKNFVEGMRCHNSAAFHLSRNNYVPIPKKY